MLSDDEFWDCKDFQDFEEVVFAEESWFWFFFVRGYCRKIFILCDRCDDISNKAIGSIGKALKEFASLETLRVDFTK